jgi:cytochrome c oxidase assembly protein subunit 15
MMTLILAGWIAWKDPRPWLRTLGWIAFLAVVVQGILGGLRVVWLKDQIGIIHACLAQAFFVLVGAIALFTTRWWVNHSTEQHPVRNVGALKRLVLGTTILVFVQLIFGAAMRHAHAGLSITDFPLAYGSLIPPMDAASVAAINAERVQWLDLPPTSAFQIGLQFIHRIVAVAILGGVIWTVLKIRKAPDAGPVARAVSGAWLALVGVQMVLGASTIWTNKAADIATAHVVVGSLTLLAGSLLSIILIQTFESPRGARAPEKTRRTTKVLTHQVEMAR